jgi:anti-anti-sigma regulatory factor
MEYFRREIVNDIVIEKVNLTNITFIEAKVFWERLQRDIYSGYVHFIIDLSSCLMIDKTFIDMILNTYRILVKRNGKVRLVLNSLIISDHYKIATLSNYIGVHNSVETAINHLISVESDARISAKRKFNN